MTTDTNVPDPADKMRSIIAKPGAADPADLELLIGLARNNQAAWREIVHSDHYNKWATVNLPALIEVSYAKLGS